MVFVASSDKSRFSPNVICALSHAAVAPTICNTSFPLSCSMVTTEPPSAFMSWLALLKSKGKFGKSGGPFR